MHTIGRLTKNNLWRSGKGHDAGSEFLGYRYVIQSILYFYFFMLCGKILLTSSFFKNERGLLTCQDQDKEKWMKVMTTEMRSSEDSNSEHGDTIVVKPLLWRSLRVTKFFYTLDNVKASKSSQARKTHFERFSIISTTASVCRTKWPLSCIKSQTMIVLTLLFEL